MNGKQTRGLSSIQDAGRKERRRQRIILCRLFSFQSSISMEIQYRTSRTDAWRCNLYIVLRRPATWVLFLVHGVILTWFFYWQYPAVQSSLSLHSRHVWWLPALFFGTICALLVFTLALFWKRVCVHYPDSETRPVTVTAISPDCLHDSSRKFVAGRIVLVPKDVPWTSILSMQWHDGDLYIRRKGGTNFIPRTAFDNPRESHLFFETAVHYWRSAQAGQAAVGAPARDGIWPPAPRV